METRKIKIISRFHIYTGKKEGSEIRHELQAGEAYEVEHEKPHYVVKMWAFPFDAFYLCQNKDSQIRFTLFGKKLEEGGNLKFRRPVGYGFLSKDLKKHLEIQFTFPRQKVFMSLFPSEVTRDSLLSEYEVGI